MDRLNIINGILIKNISYIIILLCFSSILLGNFDVDSLKNELTNQQGVERALTLDRLVKVYNGISPDDRLDYAFEYYELSNLLEVDSIEALATFGLGISYYYVGDLDSAIKYNELALAKFRELKDTLRIAAIVNNLGVFYNQLGLYEESINQYFTSLEIKENIKDTNGLGKVYNNIGALYHRWGKPKEAIEMFQKSLKYKRFNSDSTDVYELYRNLGITYFAIIDPNINIENFEDGSFTRNQLINSELKFINELDSVYIDTSNYYFNLAKKGFESLKDTSYLALVWASEAYIYFHLGKRDEAEKLYKKSLKYLLESKQYFDYARSTLALVDIYIIKGDYQSAEYYLKEAEEIVNYVNYRFLKTQIYELRAILYSKLGNYKEAFEYTKKFIVLKDSLFNEKSLTAIEELEKKYQLEQKDAQLKIANQKAEVLNQQRLILVISIVFLVLVAILLTHRYYYKQNINKILREKNDELDSLNKSKDKFFSIIAHDLKSPFFGLLNFSQLLKMAKEEKNEKEIDELIDDLNNLTKQTYSLIENLLTWSRSQTGSIKYNPEEYSIKFLVDDIVNLNINNAQSKGIEIKTNFHNLDDKISIDINMIQTVLRNLISNAIKFTPLGGKIEVGSNDKQNGFIEFYVKDSGVGISEENIEKLFKIDESFSTQGTSNEKGTGIGLNLCYEFVHKNGGDIRVESQLNKGSTFYFTCKKVS